MRFFFGFARPSQNPQNVVLVFFAHNAGCDTSLPPHGAASQRCHQSLSPIPARSSKKCQKGKHEKDIPRLFSEKKKTLQFSKNPVKTPGGGCTHFWMFMFFSLTQKVLTMIHLGLALHSEGRPFFQKRATQHLKEKCMCKVMKNDTEK